MLDSVPSDVTKLSIYVVNYRPEDFDLIREAGTEFFPQRNPPAGVVLGVQSLPKEGLLVAIDAIPVTRGEVPARGPGGGHPPGGKRTSRCERWHGAGAR